MADRADQLAKARAEVEKTIRDAIECRHRALDKKYNLLRVSERRWRIVRIASEATLLFNHVDVITFEMVTGPLTFEDALTKLSEYRGKEIA